MAAFASADMTTTTWMKFFRDAGIPPQVAGNYAVLFADHRIQTDMLQDLSRDILQAMGVTVMGDIIAILKHAKQKYEQVTREKALGNEIQLSSKPILEPRRPIQVSSGPIHVSNRPQVADAQVEISPIRTSTPAIRTLERLTQQSSSPRVSASRANNPKAITTRVSVSRQSSSALVSRQPRTVISLKRKEVAEEVPVKKVRRVLPEHEGRYSIKMPVGITPKTRRLLEQQTTGQVKVSPKTSVFSRLGDPKVSSTTGNGSEGTKITVTNFGRSVAQPKTISLKNASVFDRLGPGKSQVSSTSIDGDELEFSMQEMLPYQGVLKGDKRPTPTATIGPMKVLTKKTGFAATKKMGILARLGPQAGSTNTLGITKRVGTTPRLKLAAPVSRLVVRKAQSVGLKSDGILAAGSKTKVVPLKNRLGPKTNAARHASSIKMIRTISTIKKPNPIATLTTGRKLRLVNKQISTGTDGGIFSRLGQLQA